MSDARRDKSETVDVPIDLNDEPALRQFFTDILLILSDMQQRLDHLEDLVQP